MPTPPSTHGMTPGFARWWVVHIVASGTVTLLALVHASFSGADAGRILEF